MEKRHRIVLSVLVALLLATVLSLGASFHPLTAHAGTNGQQLEVATGASFMCVSGHNQNGTYIPDQCFPLNGSPGTTQIPGWWWKGQLDIKFYDASWNLLGEDNTNNVNVPVDQGFFNDWWYFEEAF